MSQIFYDFDLHDSAEIDRQRRWAKDHFIENIEGCYADLGMKLNLIKVILLKGWIEPTEIWKLQSLGVVFGDALSQKLGLVWMIVEDEYGRDPILKDPASTLTVNPITMISKRAEQGQALDILELFQWVCNHVHDIRCRRHKIGEN